MNTKMIGDMKEFMKSVCEVMSFAYVSVRVIEVLCKNLHI